MQNVRGSEIRFRYRCATDQRDAARAAAGELRSAWLAAGAVSVKVEEQVVANVRARAPEVATATTLTDRLRAYWRARAIDMPPEREARVLAKLGELGT